MGIKRRQVSTYATKSRVRDANASLEEQSGMNISGYSIPVLGFAAYSGSGKTTLLEKVIPLLKREGIRLAMVKHSHHDFELDRPGKDSHRLRQAGANQVMLASQYRTAWIREGDGNTEPDLYELLPRLDLEQLDLVLVEGFRHQDIQKIEIHRPSQGVPMLSGTDSEIIAIACDETPMENHGLPLLPLNDPQRVAEFIRKWMDS